jgi:hypothetical protein
MSQEQPDNSGTFSITVLDAQEINKECVTQISILEELIKDHIEKEDKNTNVMSLLCESYQTSHKIISISSRVLEENDRLGDPGKEEILINSTDMLVLQTAMMARYYVGLDLVSISGLSTAIH